MGLRIIVAVCAAPLRTYARINIVVSSTLKPGRSPGEDKNRPGGGSGHASFLPTRLIAISYPFKLNNIYPVVREVLAPPRDTFSGIHWTSCPYFMICHWHQQGLTGATLTNPLIVFVAHDTVSLRMCRLLLLRVV
jgi:hypothetical protein